MKRILLFLAILLAAPPAFAQIIPPNQFINAVSSGITVCTSGNCATWSVPNSAPSLTAQITGTMTSMTVTFEGTADGQTWFSVLATNLSTGSGATTATATGQYAIVNPGVVAFRVRCTTYSSGGVNVTLTRGSASAKAGIGGGGGSPSVTNHAVAVGTGASGSLTSVGPGAVNTVLHGAGASADPTFAAVVEGDLSLTDITTANASSSAHGFLPKESGNAYDWFTGAGTFTQTMARGSIATSSPWNFTQTWNAGAVTFAGLTETITDTASAEGSSYLALINATGTAGAIVKDTMDLSSGATNVTGKAALALNNGIGTNSTLFLRTSNNMIALGSSLANTGLNATLWVRRAATASASLNQNSAGSVMSTTGFTGVSGANFSWVSSATDGLNGTVDTALNRTSAAVVEVNNGTPGTLGAFKGAYQVVTLKDSNTAPTIASGGCTSPAVTHSNGTAAFLLTVGTSCTGVKTIVLTMPAASHFWACDANNNTSDAQQQSNTIASRATSTTAVTLTNYARTTGLQADYTASDTLLVKCSGE